MQQIPVTVFSGFLGSGKTTIISHLIDALQSSDQQVIYIKNEIGDENVDGKLMQGKHIQTKELLNGCICCTLVGPFINAIDEVIEKFHPDRILIEASGAADPAAIALLIDGNPKLKRDGVISIIDVVNFDGYKNLSLTAQNQTKFTDLLVFNKVELADFKRKEAVVGYVRELNNHSPVVEAPGGVLNPEVAFGLYDKELGQLLADEKSGHTHQHHHDHLEEDGITTFHIVNTFRYEQEAVTAFLQELAKAIYRVKGFVQLTDGSFVLINKVGTRVTIESAPIDMPLSGSSFVCIGFHISELENELTKKLEKLAK